MLWPHRLARGGATACVGLVPATGDPKLVEPSTHLWVSHPLVDTQGQVWEQGSPRQCFLDRTVCHGGTPLPSSEVGAEGVFRAVAGSPCPSLAAETPGGSCGQSNLVEP